MASENEIEVDFVPVDGGMASELEKFSSIMKTMLSDATKTRAEYTALVAKLKEIPARQADLRNQAVAAAKDGNETLLTKIRDEIKSSTAELKDATNKINQARNNLQSASEGKAAAANSLSNTNLGGRTLAESQIRNQAIAMVSTALNTTDEQMMARIADAAAKAAERLLKTAEKSLIARFNQVGVSEQIRQETFTNPLGLQARVTRARIGEEKLIRDYGPDAAQTLAGRDRGAEMAANARAAALAQRDAANAANRTFDQTRSGDAAGREVSRDASFANRYGVDRASFQARIKDESLSIDEQKVALAGLAAQKKDALARSAAEEAEAYSLNRAFNTERKKALDAEAASLRTAANNADKLYEERKKQSLLNIRREADQENARLTPEVAARQASRDAGFAKKYGIERSDFASQIKDENLSIDQQRVLLRGLAEDTVKANAAKRATPPKAPKTEAEVAADRAAKRQQSNENLDDRLSENGGATFFGFQARIAANYAIFGAAVSSVRSAMSAIVEFDDVMKKFQAITDTTNTEMVSFRSNLLGIASDSKFSVTEIGQVAIQLGQTGLAAGEVIKALKPVIDLATASGSTLQQAVEAVTGVLGAYAIEASRAGDISDVFVGALNRTKLTMDQLQLGIQYAANIARDSGVSFSELTATIGSVAQAGVKSGSTIGTGVRQLLTELSSPTEKFRTVLKELGISLADVDLKTNGLTGVLTNLRDKGFTTADALRSLDLRAAAAFSALAGQGDRVKTLQQELLLTSAAADATTKANESLASGFQRFQNSAFAVVDKALGPMVEALKGAVGGAAALFQGLSQLGPILPVIGTGLAALAAAATALKIGSLIAGLAAGATIAAPVAIAAGAISALVAGGGLISYLDLLDSRADAATKRLDQLKAAENDVMGQASSLETNTNSINSTILQLIDRREKLNADPVLRRTAVIEAQKAFGELGLTISSSITNIDDLVEALQRLRGGLAAQTPNVLLDQLRLIREETKQLLILQQEQSKKNTKATTYIDDDAPIGYQTETVRAMDKFNSLQGPGFDRARDIIGKPESFGTDILAAAGPAYAALQDEQTKARNLRAQAVTAGDMKEAALQDRRLDLLSDLNKLIAEAVGTQNNINAKKMKEDALVQSNEAALITARPETQNIIKNVESLYGQRSQSQRSTLSDTSLSELQKRAKLAENLEVFKDAGNLQLTFLNDLGERLKSEGVPKEAVEEALGPLRNKIAEISKGIDEPLRQQFEAVSVGAKAILESQKKGIQLQIEARLKSAASARDMPSIDASEDEIKALVDRQSKIITELAKLTVINPSEIESNPQVREKLSEDQANLRTQLEGYAEKISAAKRRLTEKLLEYRDIGDAAQKERLQKEAGRLQKILDDANTTPEKAKELVAEINRLLTEAANIAKGMNARDVERKMMSAPSDGGTALPGAKAGDGSTAKAIIDAANQRGADAEMTRYLLALSQLESKQNPNAKAPGSTASGILQFIDGTWNGDPKKGVPGYGKGGDRFNVDDSVDAGLRFTQDNDRAFRAKFGRDPTGEERFVLHNQGSGGGIGLLGDPDSLARNRVSADAITGNGGTLNMTSGQFVEVLKQMYRDAFKQTEGQSTSAKTVLAQSGKDADGAVDEKLAQDREKGEKRVREIERNNELIRLKSLDREDVARYEGQASLVKRALNPSDAMTASTQALQTLAELRGNALTRDEVQNRGRPEAQKVEDQAGIDAAFREKAQTAAVNAADTIGKLTLKTYDDQLEQAQNRIKDLKRDSSDGKYNADELNQLNQQVEALQKKKELQGQLESYDAQIASLNQSINQIQDSGLGNRKDLLRITEQLAALETKMKALAPGVESAAKLEKTAPSLGNALSLGTDDFLKSRGIKNNLGELVDSTAQARKMLAADLNVIAGGFDSLFTNLFNGSMKAGDALKKFATDILSGLLSQASKALTNSIFAGLFGGASGGAAGGGSIFSSIGSFLGGGSFIGFANGGMPVPAAGMATGGHVDGGVPNRDSVTRRLMPGEFVLRRSAVQAMGRDNLESINAMGNSMVSKAPQMSIAGLGAPSARAQSNVYVVSPEAKPPPSRNDIVYMVGEDIQTGGQLAKLIKSTVAGH
jgi:TP901 family phage tail tape measure protein